MWKCSGASLSAAAMRLASERDAVFKPFAQDLRRDVGKRARICKKRQQPVVEAGAKRLIRHVRPCGFVGIEECEAVAKPARGFAPVERGKPVAAQMRHDDILRRVLWGKFRRSLAERQRAKTARHLDANAAGLRIEECLASRLDGTAMQRLDLVHADRCCREDPRGGRHALQIGNDNEGTSRQRLGLVEYRATPARQLERAALAAPSGDAVGPGKRQQRACRKPALCGVIETAGDRAGKAPRRIGALALFLPQAVEPLRKVDAVAAQTALGRQHREHRRVERLSVAPRLHHHVGEARRQRQGAHGLAFRRDPRFAVERAKPLEQFHRLVPCRLGRQVEKGQACRIADAPGGEVKRKARKIGLEDLRRVVCRQRRRLLLAPKAYGDARRGASRATGALGDCRAGGPHCLESRQARARLVDRHALQTAVDDDAHAVDRQRGFGDRGRQHHLALALGRRPDRGILRARIDRTIELEQADIGRQRCLQPFGCAADFLLAGQECEHRAVFLGKRATHCPRNGVLHRLACRAFLMADFDGMRTAGTFDDRRAARQSRYRLCLQRCRHDEDLEVVPQRLLHVERQREAEIGVERALVKFVEDDSADTAKFRVIHDHPREHAFGHEKNAGPRRGPAFEPHAIPDRLARLLAKLSGHERGGGACGDAAGLQHHDQARAPWRRGEGEGNTRRLARAGRCAEHGGVSVLERRKQARQSLVHRLRHAWQGMAARLSHRDRARKARRPPPPHPADRA